MQGQRTMLTKLDHQRFRMAKIAEYGVVLTDDHENGLAYAEGELNDYSSCDAVDPWEGAAVGRQIAARGAESAAAFVRHVVREICLHEADEQLRVGDRRPFAPEH